MASRPPSVVHPGAFFLQVLAAWAAGAVAASGQIPLSQEAVRAVACFRLAEEFAAAVRARNGLAALRSGDYSVPAVQLDGLILA